MLKLCIENIHPKEDWPYVKDQFSKQIQGKITLAKDIPILRKDKKVIYCDINSRLVEIGKKEYMVGFFRDITERKKAEEQIKKTSEEWRKTLDAISDFIFGLDRDNRFVRVTKALCDFLRKEPKELMGKRCYEVLHGTDKALLDCPCERAKVTKKAETLEIDDANSGLTLLLAV